MAVKRALETAIGGNKSIAIASGGRGHLGDSDPNMSDDDEEHAENVTALNLRLEPTEGAYDRWRLFKIHNFAVTADRWAELSHQKVIPSISQLKIKKRPISSVPRSVLGLTLVSTGCTGLCRWQTGGRGPYHSRFLSQMSSLG